MAEDVSQSKDDVFPPALAGDQPGPEDTGVGLCQSSIETLQQRRRKCELKRLLKHTHPEITMLDQVVEKELEAVLSSETEVAAAEMGYEGEVLSKCLIFENCTVSKKGSPYTTSMHMAQEEADRRGQTPTVLEEPGNQSDPNIELIDNEIRIDVQSARMMFEKQSLKATQSIQHMSQEHTLDKMKRESKIKCSGSTDQQHKEEPHDDAEISDEDFTSLLEPETLEESIKTSLDLFQHNPFIAANIEKEHLCLQSTTSNPPEEDCAIVEDYLRANVKNRAHLFESMPFHKIRHQNKDDVETMVENIKETLHFLHSANVIRSSGSIIEVNETMRAKKAKFTQTENGPEILYQDVAEGGAQNLILQLLPRANTKPQITYLREDSKGGVAATVVNAPVHQHQFVTSQDTEFKTANVVQLIEDILNQDNSLRKGVLIPEEVGRCAEVIVYSLYNYLDVEDIKSYSPPPDTAAEYTQPATKTSETTHNEILGLKSGKIESTINCLLETSQNQVFTASTTPDITTKGNVKLFKSCIEKGELEYLKSLHAETEVSDQEIPLDSPEQNTAIRHEPKSDNGGDSAPEYEPVDIKKLKSLFSTDQKETQLYKNEAAWSNGRRVKNTMKKSPPPTDCQSQEEINPKQHHFQSNEYACRFIDPSRSYVPFEDDNRIHQAQLVVVVDECEEMSDLQTAIDNLQKATVEAKSIHDSLQERQDKLQSHRTSLEESSAPLKTKEGLFQDNVHKEGMCSIAQWDVQKSDFKCEKKEFQQIQTTEVCGKPGQDDANSERATVQSHGSVTKTEEEEVVLHGKLQAAFQALERSNINVTRGDFRAAMIYRNSRSQKEPSVAFEPSSRKNTTQETACSETKSTKSPFGHDVATVGKEITDQSEFTLEKNKKRLGPKPAIPPKPEHLTVNKMTIPTDTNTDSTQSQQTKPYGNDEQQVKTDRGLVGLGNDAVEIQAPSQASSYITDITADKLEGNSVRVENKVNNDETDESHVNFHEACQKFGGKKTALKKTAPVKPKRVKIAVADAKSREQADSTTVTAHADMEQTTTPRIKSHNCGQITDTGEGRENKAEGKVEMREKRVRRETEDERRQRLSVHMDEIVRGNSTAAMEIFDNLRKQEELQNILSRVEEIEQDTSEVDGKSLSEVFEDVPDWVVRSAKKKKKKKKERVQKKVEKSQLAENKSSVANVFGDLERASEEIIHLKEQTLARLMDIEETIKKALSSVSNLKSESDIAGLSSLFKESLGTAQTATSSGSISKISIGSSRTKTQDSSTLKTNQSQVSSCEVASGKQQVSPSASPAFISIQSAARKTDVPPEMTLCPSCQHDSKPEGKFRTTKTLKCSPTPIRKEDPRKGGQKQSSYSPLNPKRELSVLEVQTDLKGTGVVGTKTIYERGDDFCNEFYSTKASTVLTTQPQTLRSSPTQAVTGPSSFQVSSYPEVRLPITQKPEP